MTPEERRRRNAASVEAFYQAERDRDIDAWRSKWRSDGRHTYPFNASRTVSGIDELVQITARKFEVRPHYEIHTVVEPFADPNRVLARLHLLFRGDLTGEIHIWCIFHFDDEGLVKEVEEMLDTSSSLPVPK